MGWEFSARAAQLNIYCTRTERRAKFGRPRTGGSPDFISGCLKAALLFRFFLSAVVVCVVCWSVCY